MFKIDFVEDKLF